MNQESVNIRLFLCFQTSVPSI